jgi:PAS domain S-box-containing protein
VPPTRFDSYVNRLRAALRGHHDAALLLALREQIEAIPAAAFAADNSSRYVGTNEAARALTGYSAAELLGMTVMDLTPMPKTAAGQKLWEEFIAKGGQRGEYELWTKQGVPVKVRYWAYASVAPGIHLSLLVPSAAAESAG